MSIDISFERRHGCEFCDSSDNFRRFAIGDVSSGELWAGSDDDLSSGDDLWSGTELCGGVAWEVVSFGV